MFVSISYILRIILTFVLPSLNQQHSMHCLSYTKSRCLTNTPTRFGAHCLRLSKSALSNVNFPARQTVSNNCPNMCCRIGVFTRGTLFVKLQGGRWKYVNTCHFKHIILKYSQCTTIYIVLWYCAPRCFER